ncbi:hypothetical protein [Georgenia muralis]|uniref:Glycosyltransferase involved in cell wall biosynthesis n=1 Tax=Georgenia muralis TaxID=154117 RepID=A0A3N4ZYE1_9MICO|nr:hypothetical protein [Georgenia muralis]RPF26085.1 glycosyltransferase involved in cell wall biosynthesis [Georgenia muralis]
MTGSRDGLDRDHVAFAHLLVSARTLLDQGRLAAAAASCQVAAHHAWLNPSGIFASAELEQLLIDVGRRLPRTRVEVARTSDPGTVLHVATQAYQSGGSTQYIASWADQDRGRRHVLLLTRQLTTPLPEKLDARRRDGVLRIVRADTMPGGILGRALALRRAAARADVVLVHAHPGDVVPVLALADQGTSVAPVVLVDQADHVFWVGVSIAQTLLSMRRSGAALAVRRRGVEPSRIVMGMRPLETPARTMSREAAKRQLGIDPTDVLVLTAADASKYEPVGGPSLVEMVLPVFLRNRHARLLAAGPAPEGEWARAARLTHGRVRALGPLPHVGLLHQAADVYLDSFPFASLTSLLESGTLGNPVVTYRGHPEGCDVLGADTEGVDEAMSRPTTPDGLRQELSLLVDEAPARHQAGDAIRASILDRHGADVWQTEARRVYAHAARSSPEITLRVPPRRTGTLEELVRQVVTRSPHSQGVPGSLRSALGLLPAGERLSAVHALRRHGVALTAADMLADRQRVAAAAASGRLRPHGAPGRQQGTSPATSPPGQLDLGQRAGGEPQAGVLLEPQPEREAFQGRDEDSQV